MFDKAQKEGGYIFNDQRLRRLSRVAGTVFLLAAWLSTGAFATEDGGGAYSNGAEDFNAGRLPPFGTYFFNYFVYHYADRLRDNGGNTMHLNFSQETTGNGFRFMHVMDKKFLGADIGMYVVIPIAHLHVTFLGRSQSK